MTASAAVDEVPRRCRNRSTDVRSTDVAGQVALLASIPLARGDDVVEQSIDLPPGGATGRQVSTSASQNVDVHDRCRSVSFDDDIQQSPHTEESR